MRLIDRLLVFLMVLSMFLDDYIIGNTDSDARRASPFDFYYYYIIFLAFLLIYVIRFKKLPFFPKWFSWTLLILFAASLIAGSLSAKLQFSMAKQFIGITFSAVAYYNLIKFVQFDIKYLFKLYLKLAFYIALIGVIEEYLRLTGFNYLFDNVKQTSTGFYRVYSIMGEPYFLSVVLIPSVYYYLSLMIGPSYIRDRKQLFHFLIITACFFLTFSSAGFVGFAIMLCFVLYNHGYFNPSSGRFILFVLFFFLVSPSLNLKSISIKEIEIRIQDSYKAFGGGSSLDKKDIAKLNSSTFALFSNFLIAQKSFSANPAIGSGLGTHEQTYNSYFETLFGKKFLIMYGMFNAKDGNSLFIRLMSETGLLGLFLFFFFMFRFLLSRKHLKNPELSIYIIINQAIFIVFLIRLLRTGNYISQGFFFFFFLYYFSYTFVKKAEKEALVA